MNIYYLFKYNNTMNSKKNKLNNKYDLIIV